MLFGIFLIPKLLRTKRGITLTSPAIGYCASAPVYVDRAARRSSNAKKEWKLPVTLSRDGQLGAAASSDMKYSIIICQAIRFLGRKIVWCPCAFTRCTTGERKSNKNWQ